MLVKFFDKLIFAAALIFALQGQQLLEHYQQFLSGLYESTKWQVEGYQATATQHQYPDLMAMIEDHQKNTNASVRTDAEQKLATLQIYDELAEGMAIFKTGHALDKALFMLKPARYDYLKKTIKNFTLGMPLSIGGWVFALIAALIFNGIFMLPIKLVSKPRKI